MTSPLQFRQTGTLSGKGSGDDLFAQALRGLATDRDGQLYAVGDSEVKVFDPEGG